MKVHFLIVVMALTASLAFAQDPPDKKEGPLKTDAEKQGYAVGLSFGRNLAHQGVKIDLNALWRGLTDALEKKPPVLTPKELRAALMALNARSKAKKQSASSEQAQKNTQEGQNFLAANKKKEGVVTLPSGLQYQIIKPGTGAMPAATDRVVTHYRGTLIDGTEFDSSYRRGQPATFPVGGVIGGWTEALQLMKVGGKWKLFVPPNLAYGRRGSGSKIGPNATLIFEVELLEIK